MKMSSAMNIFPVDMLRARRTVPLKQRLHTYILTYLHSPVTWSVNISATGFRPSTLSFLQLVIIASDYYFLKQ